jgi:hypothetical protein
VHRDIVNERSADHRDHPNPPPSSAEIFLPELKRGGTSTFIPFRGKNASPAMSPSRGSDRRNYLKIRPIHRKSIQFRTAPCENPDEGGPQPTKTSPSQKKH